MGFGEIFTSLGGYSSPYEALGYEEAVDRTRGSRVEIAKAFTEWRKANPEAGADEMSQFFSMATGGDETLAGPAFSGGDFRKRMEDQSLKAKTKRLRDEQSAKMVDDQKWGQVIEQNFEKNLVAKGYNVDAAWKATQDSLLNGITDSELAADVKRRTSNFDPRGHAAGMNSKYISDNFAVLTGVYQNALIAGKTDDEAFAVMNAYGSGRSFDPSNAGVMQIISGAQTGYNDYKDKKAKDKLATDNLAADRANTELERQERKKKDERDETTRIETEAGRAAAFLAQGASPDFIAKNYPDIPKEAIAAAQRANFDIAENKASTSLPTAAAANVTAQAEALNIDEISKNLLKDNPTVVVALRELNGQYALNERQRAAVSTVLVDPKLKTAKYAEVKDRLAKAVMSGGTPTTHLEYVKTQSSSVLDRIRPATWGSVLAERNKRVSASIEADRATFTAAMKLPNDRRIPELNNAAASLKRTLSKLNELYGQDLTPTEYGQARNQVEATESIERQRVTAQKLLEEVVAEYTKIVPRKDVPPAKKPAGTAGATMPATDPYKVDNRAVLNSQKAQYDKAVLYLAGFERRDPRSSTPVWMESLAFAARNRIKEYKRLEALAEADVTPPARQAAPG